MTQQKTALFLGPCLAPPLQETEIHTIRRGDSLESIGHIDNVILYGHGQVINRNTEKETHKMGLRENNSSTMPQLLKVMEATSPQHIDLVSCFGGSFGEDIQKKENFDQLVALMKKHNQKDFTISVCSSSKHPTFSYVAEPYMAAIASLEASTDPGMQRVGLMRKFPETLKQYNIHIDDNGQASLVGFKIRSPKSSNEIDHPESFIGSHALYGSKAENKETRQISQIVTEIGQDDPRHDELLRKIQAELLKEGATFSPEYTYHAALLSAIREKPDLMKKWVSTLPNDQEKGITIRTILRQEIKFNNSELVQAIVDAAPAEERPNVLADLLIRKALMGDEQTRESILSTITPNEKVNLISHFLTKKDADLPKKRNEIITMLKLIDVNTRDDDENTIIHKAMQNGSPKVIEVLSGILYEFPNIKIDITLRNKNGQTALDLAQTNVQKKAILSSAGIINTLSEAVQYSNIPTVQKFLVAGCDVNTKSATKVPLIGNAIHSIPMLKLLIASNADIEAHDGNGKTALSRAYSRSSLDPKIIPFIQETEEGRQKEKSPSVDKSSVEFHLCNAVLKHDLDSVQSLITSGVDVNSKNFYDDPLLNVATRRGDAKMVEILLKAGANPTIKGRWGDTALQIAEEYKNKEVSSLLDLHTKQTTLERLAHSPAVAAISHTMDGLVMTTPHTTTHVPKTTTHDKGGHQAGVL